MSLFKNSVGRPSNETLKKRKIAYICIIVLLSALLCGAVVLTVKHFKGDGNADAKYASLPTEPCVMPYQRGNCKNVYNGTVKAIQTVLSLTGYYSGGADGYYGDKTYNAVLKFQEKYKSETGKPDGSVGPATLRALMKRCDGSRCPYAYYDIKYAPNGGSGSINQYKRAGNVYWSGSYSNQQIVVYPTTTVGVNIETYSTYGQYTKSGYNHVGYFVTSNSGSTTYYYGCSTKSCNASNYRAYTATAKKQLELQGKWYNYLWPAGGSWNFGSERLKIKKGTFTGTSVTMTAQYCSGSGTGWDYTTSSCKGSGGGGGGNGQTITPGLACTNSTGVKPGSSFTCTLTYNFASSLTVNWTLTTNKGSTYYSSTGTRGSTTSSRTLTVPSGASGTANVTAVVAGKAYYASVPITASGVTTPTSFAITKNCAKSVTVTAPNGLKKITIDYYYKTTCKSWFGRTTSCEKKASTLTLNLGGQTTYTFAPTYVYKPSKGTIKAWDKKNKTVNRALNVNC